MSVLRVGITDVHGDILAGEPVRLGARSRQLGFQALFVQPLWHVDIENSPVADWMNLSSHGNVARSGRLYCTSRVRRDGSSGKRILIFSNFARGWFRLLREFCITLEAPWGRSVRVGPVLANRLENGAATLAANP